MLLHAFTTEGDSSYNVDEGSYHQDTNGSTSHDNDEEHHPVCTEDMRQYVTHVFLLDRFNVHSPNVLMELPSIKFHFSKYIRCRPELSSFLLGGRGSRAAVRI